MTRQLGSSLSLPPVLVLASLTFLLRPGTLPLQPEVSLLYSDVLAFPLTPTGSPDLGLPVSVTEPSTAHSSPQYQEPLDSTEQKAGFKVV